MVTFEETADELDLITIHPLKDGQKERRIERGRWVERELQQ